MRCVGYEDLEHRLPCRLPVTCEVRVTLNGRPQKWCLSCGPHGDAVMSVMNSQIGTMAGFSAEIRLVALTDHAYTCVRCGLVFESAWSDQAGLEEFRAMLAASGEDELGVLCDECFAKFLAWVRLKHPEYLEQRP